VTIRYDLSPSEYHADLDGPSLSSTCAHDLLTLSPLHAQLHHPRFGRAPREATDAMDNGSLIDALLLGNGKSFAVCDVAYGPKYKGEKGEPGSIVQDWQTADARAFKRAAREQGRIPVLANDFAEAELTVGRISEKLLGLGIRLSGKSQVALTWNERARNGNTVKCRALLDHLIVQEPAASATIWDLKTIASAHPDAIQKAIELRGYAVQAEAYEQGLVANVPTLAGRVQYGLLFCETQAPWDVVPVYLGGDMRQIGAHRWQRAVDLWERCLRTNMWPGYLGNNDRLTINASRYALAKYEEELINEDV
jgi:PDDEXK-like domain of unknown function (DUF3799)